MPNAEVVADRFHVMKLVNDELDTERKALKRKLKKVKKRTAIRPRSPRRKDGARRKLKEKDSLKL